MGNECAIYLKSNTDHQLVSHHGTVGLSSLYIWRAWKLYTKESLGWP